MHCMSRAIYTSVYRKILHAKDFLNSQSKQASKHFTPIYEQIRLFKMSFNTLLTNLIIIDRMSDAVYIDSRFFSKLSRRPDIYYE